MDTNDTYDLYKLLLNLTLGEKLRYFRQREQFSQLNLEISSSIAPGTISRIENNKTNPTKETIKQISTTLKLTDEEIALLFDLNIWEKN